MRNDKIDEIINIALAEDIGSGDITSSAVIPENLKAVGQFIVKQNGIIAGLEIARKCFNIFDSSLDFKTYKNDGDFVNRTEVIAEIEGNASSILTVERTALNFLQRMSGIAALAREFSELIKHTNARIIDTRKTAPGLRLFDKLAVQYGGCKNHRIGLYDMFLIKDNHIVAAGSIKNAVEKCREFKRSKNPDVLIEVETKNLEEVEEALNSGVDIIMLDNFEIDEMKKAVNLINGKCKVEASGMVNLNTVKAVAETGVDFISVGALTHSVKALDISLEIKLLK